MSFQEREKEGAFFLRSATWTYKQRDMRQHGAAGARSWQGHTSPRPPPATDAEVQPTPGFRQPPTLKLKPPQPIANDTGFLYTAFNAAAAPNGRPRTKLSTDSGRDSEHEQRRDA